MRGKTSRLCFSSNYLVHILFILLGNKLVDDESPSVPPERNPGHGHQIVADIGIGSTHP